VSELCAMSSSSVESLSWTSENLRHAVTRDASFGSEKLKDNSGGKAARWKQLKLVETDDGNEIFGWAVCAD